MNYDHHYILGVSLGGPTEHTTVALADQFLVSSGGNFLVQKTHVVDIERHAPGIPLPDLVAAIHALKRKLGDDADWRGPCLVLDIGSAGWAVHDMLSARDREHYVRMVAGIGERGGSRGERLLGRQELIGLVRREVHTDRLKIAQEAVAAAGDPCERAVAEFTVTHLEAMLTLLDAIPTAPEATA